METESHDAFWEHVCARARRVLAVTRPEFASWSAEILPYWTKRDRLEAETEAKQHEEFIESAHGYLDRAQNRLVVLIDAELLFDEASVREYLETQLGIAEDDPEVSAARWIVESVESHLRSGAR